MKIKLFTLAICTVLFSGCQQANKQSAAPSPTPSVQPIITETSQEAGAPDLDASEVNLVVVDENFGIDEIYGVQGEPLSLIVRNQRQEPINVVIDELRVKSPEIKFGEEYTVEIPTDEVGEFEMYSSIGSQREAGFTATVVIEEF